MARVLGNLSAAELESFCQRHGIRRLAVFGSAIRQDFTAASDIDVLVEFQPGRTPGLEFFRIEQELTRLFGRSVDLHTAASLSPYFRDEVLEEAEDVYVAA